MTDHDNHGGKIVVITGASAGVGRATVRAFADAGWSVGLIARGGAGLEAARCDVVGRGGRACAVATDVADWQQVEAAAQRIEDELGPIDVWVNNAMTTVFARFLDVEPHEFRRATEVTYLGQVYGTRAALLRMTQRGRGTIVNVESALAFVSIPLQSPYCGAKFAARGFTQSVREELLHDRSPVRVAMVHLPAVNTPQFSWCRTRLPDHPQPVPPIYPPERAAAVILATALDPSHDRILGSWNRLVIWGGRFAPRLLERFAAHSAVGGQQTQERERSHHDNLFDALDEDRDVGASGVFAHRDDGVVDPAFLRGLPTTLATGARALAAEWRSKLDRVIGNGADAPAPSPR